MGSTRCTSKPLESWWLKRLRCCRHCRSVTSRATSSKQVGELKQDLSEFGDKLRTKANENMKFHHELGEAKKELLLVGMFRQR